MEEQNPKKEQSKKEIELVVAEARQDDVNKGIVRIDTKFMKDIDARPGDFIEISGERQSFALIDRAYPSDLGLNLIRMDALTRSNAGTSVGERVRIKKADVKEAKKVKLAPAEKGIKIEINGNPQALTRALLGRTVVKGDILSLGGTKSRKITMSGSPLFEDIFKTLMEDESFFSPFPFYRNIKWMVISTLPQNVPVLITDRTEVEISNEPVTVSEKRIPKITYEDIGGLDKEIEKVKEMIELPMKHPELFERLGIEPPKGVLLYGPPGTGKTLLAKAVANESSAYFISIAGPEIMSKWVGEAEKKIRDIFYDAEKNAPAIIFIDEIDAIAPKREEVTGEVERRVVAQILNLMDGMKSRGQVIVIAATNRENAIDPALRRPGRFDREIEIGVPDAKGRLNILKIHTRNMPLSADVNLETYSRTTHGFVGADLEELCKEVAMHALRRMMPEIIKSKDNRIDSETLQKIQVTKEDFDEGMKLVSPSAMREVLIESPNVKWEDIGGLESVKETIKESIEWPLKYPESFKRLGIDAPKGIILYGPPGCGKTMLAKAIATETECNFISIKGPEIFSKWVGESEKAVREIFRKARQVAPCIIFFDEIDSIVPHRGGEAGERVSEKVVNQLLTELDGLESLKDVVVIGATNRPDLIDSSLLRPGRFDRLILVPPPDMETRYKILSVYTKRMPLSKKIDLKKTAKETDMYSGADLYAVCREAGLSSLRENKESKEVTKEQFEGGIIRVKPSLKKEVMDFYENFDKQKNQIKDKKEEYDTMFA